MKLVLCDRSPEIVEALATAFQREDGVIVRRSDVLRTGCNAVLSPGNNPYGATDPAGIYVIDCAGATIRIRYSRINARIVQTDIADCLIMQLISASAPSTSTVTSNLP